MSATGSILTNRGALAALNEIGRSAGSALNAETKISTGQAISDPADDPAGYITAQGMTSEIGGLSQAIANTNEGISLTQTAQGAIQQQIGIAQNLYSIAVQAANGTQTASERQSLQGVVGQLVGEINNIATQAQFNGISLLNGAFQDVQFQTGSESQQNEKLSISNLTAGHLGGDGAFSASTAASMVHTRYVGNSGHPWSGYAYSSGTMTFRTNKGGVDVAVGEKSSAGGLAAQINAVTSITGISATATNTVTLKPLNADESGTDLGYWKFGMFSSSNGILSPEVVPNASSMGKVAQQINASTSQTGITASLNSSGSLVLTQTQGKNITFGMSTNTSNSFETSSGVNTQLYNAPVNIYGKLTIKSASSMTATNANLAELHINKPSKYLTNIDVSTASGAASALTTISNAIGQLEQEASKIGAFQDGLSIISQNNSTIASNAKTALGVVQDANIPAATNDLTEDQLQAQAGVAALKNSSTLQQAFLSLLP